MMIFKGDIVADSANVVLRVKLIEHRSAWFTISVMNSKGDVELGHIGEFMTQEQAQKKLEEIFLQLACGTCVHIVARGEDILVQPAGTGY